MSEEDKKYSQSELDSIVEKERNAWVTEMTNVVDWLMDCHRENGDDSMDWAAEKLKESMEKVVDKR